MDMAVLEFRNNAILPASEIEVSIVDDSVGEMTENFMLSLTEFLAPTNGASLIIAPDEATVTILDDDGTLHVHSVLSLSICISVSRSKLQ